MARPQRMDPSSQRAHVVLHPRSLPGRGTTDLSCHAGAGPDGARRAVTVEPCPAEEPQPVTSPSRKNKTRSVTPGSWPSWNKSVLTYLPGEDSYSALNSAPEVTTKSSSVTGASATNAVPCTFLHDSQ